jgi:hypothetical protein
MSRTKNQSNKKLPKLSHHPIFFLSQPVCHRNANHATNIIKRHFHTLAAAVAAAVAKVCV